MAPRRTVAGKEATASRRAVFLAAHDLTHDKEVMASRRAEFIAAGGHIVTWADFEAAMAEWAVNLEAAKGTQKERKRQKAFNKRESRRRKKEEAARCGEESLTEIKSRWVVAYKAGKENTGTWQACPDGSM